MTNQELSVKIAEQLRPRHADFRMTYHDPEYGHGGIGGVGIEIHVGDKTFRNAWAITKSWDEAPEVIGGLASTWMNDVLASPEKYRAA